MTRSTPARRIAALALILAVAALIGTVAAPASAAPMPRYTLSDMEQYFMCATCHEPLEASQSPQAQTERSYLGGLIAQGLTKSQIESAMVGQFGPTVLSVPNAQGFNLVFYIVPPALLLLGLAALAIVLPRWRRRARAADAVMAATAGPPLDAADARRLDEELARYDG